jgi:hypothetical protein
MQTRYPEGAKTALSGDLRAAPQRALAARNPGPVGLHHRPQHHADADRPAGLRARRTGHGAGLPDRHGPDGAGRRLCRGLRARVVLARLALCLLAHLAATGLLRADSVGALLRLHHHRVSGHRRLCELRSDLPGRLVAFRPAGAAGCVRRRSGHVRRLPRCEGLRAHDALHRGRLRLPDRRRRRADAHSPRLPSRHRAVPPARNAAARRGPGRDAGHLQLRRL